MNQEEYESFMAQNEIQERLARAQLDMYAPQMQEQNAQAQAVLLAQTNPINSIHEIMLVLKGQSKNQNGDIIQWGKPKLNDKGIESISYILYSYISQDIVLSHFKENVIRNMIIQIGDDICDDLALNWRAYGIKDKSELDHIVDTILIKVYASFNRALEQNEKNWLGKIAMEHINAPSSIKPKKEGFLSKLRL